MKEKTFNLIFTLLSENNICNEWLQMASSLGIK